jgi:acetyl esterase
VQVLAGWGPGGGPRNVWIRREDGTEDVRPFRGLRRLKTDPPPSPVEQLRLFEHDNDCRKASDG